MVAIESISVFGATPGMIVADGANDAVAPTGSADTLNVTGFGYVPFEEERINAKLAVCPAVIAWGATGAASEKLGIVKLTADEVPPPGGGFTTVITNVPPWDKSPGNKVACNRAELTKIVFRGLPLTSTTELCVNPVPERFRVSALAPADTEPPTGWGLLTAKLSAVEANPSGFVTIT